MTEPLTVPATVAAALRREAAVLDEAVSDGEAPHKAAVVPLISASLITAGSTPTQAQEYAELLADAILSEHGPLREVWDVMVGSVKSGRPGKAAAGETRYLATRLANTSGLDPENARRFVAILATAAGVPLVASSPVQPRSPSSQPSDTTTNAESLSIGSSSARAGDKLREALHNAPLGAEIRLPGGEFQGPFEITRAVRLIGQGEATTLWMRKGPVVVVMTDGVALEALLIEATEPDGIALQQSSGAPPRLTGVTIKGREVSASSAASSARSTSSSAAHQPASARWYVPTNVDFGDVPLGTSVERFADIETPGPASVRCSLAGVHVEPGVLSGGKSRLRLRLEGSHVAAGGILAGDLEIVSGTERRTISLFGSVQASSAGASSPPAVKVPQATSGQSTVVASGVSRVASTRRRPTRRFLWAGLAAGIAVFVLASYLYQGGQQFQTIFGKSSEPTPSVPKTASSDTPRRRSEQGTSPTSRPTETPADKASPGASREADIAMEEPARNPSGRENPRDEEARVRNVDAVRRADDQRRLEVEAARRTEEQHGQEAETARIAASRAEDAQRVRSSIVDGLLRQFRDRGLRDVTVTVDGNRHVTLDGRVDDASTREEAIQIAKGYPGVSSVEAKMRVRREETRKAIEQGKFE